MVLDALARRGRLGHVDTAVIIVQGVLGLGVAAMTLVYWWLVVRRWEGRFRSWCERHYGVAITYGMKGHWQVSGGGPWYRRFAIELLQLAYFMGAFVGWAVGMVLAVVVMSLLE